LCFVQCGLELNNMRPGELKLLLRVREGVLERLNVGLATQDGLLASNNGTLSLDDTFFVSLDASNPTSGVRMLTISINNDTYALLISSNLIEMSIRSCVMRCNAEGRAEGWERS
jgi:hypothetical protein